MSRIRRLLALFILLPSLAWAQTDYESYITSDVAPDYFYYETETSGTTIVNHGSAGSGGNLTTHNSPTLGASASAIYRGTAIQWTASSSQYASVNTGTMAFPGPITWICWATADNSGGFDAVMSVGVNESGLQSGRVAGLVFTSTPKARMTLFDGPGSGVYADITGGTTLTNGSWYMLSATWDNSSTTLKLFVNGALDASSTTTTGAAPQTPSYVALGRLEGEDAHYYNGISQDCLVKFLVLTPTQIGLIYARGSSALGLPPAGRRIFQSRRTTISPYFLPVSFGVREPEAFPLNVPTFVIDQMNKRALTAPGPY